MELDAHGFTIINVDPTWFVEKPSESMFDGEISTKSFLRNWRIIEMYADDAYRLFGSFSPLLSSLTPELVNLSSLLQLARKIETLSLSLSLSLFLCYHLVPPIREHTCNNGVILSTLPQRSLKRSGSVPRIDAEIWRSHDARVSINKATHIYHRTWPSSGGAEGGPLRDESAV